ncbi:MAG: hypothetical protein QOH39_1610 [Verrucomicrobiota bacterium]|jgi:hypothetical protein
MAVSGDEQIVRAICTDKWDGERLSPSLFKGQNISVGRLAIASLADHWDIFRRFVEKPPERKLELIGEIGVAKLQGLGVSHKPRTDLTVEPRPIRDFPSHAEIPQNITRGLATKIVAELTIHRPPP